MVSKKKKIQYNWTRKGDDRVATCARGCGTRLVPSLGWPQRVFRISCLFHESTSRGSPFGQWEERAEARRGGRLVETDGGERSRRRRATQWGGPSVSRQRAFVPLATCALPVALRTTARLPKARFNSTKKKYRYLYILQKRDIGTNLVRFRTTRYRYEKTNEKDHGKHENLTLRTEERKNRTGTSETLLPSIILIENQIAAEKNRTSGRTTYGHKDGDNLVRTVPS